MSLLLWSAVAIAQPVVPELTFDTEAPRLERAERWHRFGKSSVGMVGYVASFAAVGGALYAWDRVALCGLPNTATGAGQCSDRLTWRLPLYAASLSTAGLYGTLSAPAVTVMSLGTARAIRRAGGRVSPAPGIVAVLGLAAMIGSLADDPALSSDASKVAFLGGMVASNGFASWQVLLNDRALERRRAAAESRSPR
ncbi:MAG: hypothetical protein AAF602_02595 [Myxococcota bacterium]